MTVRRSQQFRFGMPVHSMVAAEALARLMTASDVPRPVQLDPVNDGPRRRNSGSVSREGGRGKA